MMTACILETPRCRLRYLDPGDAAAIYRLNLHPDILKFTTDPPFENIDEARSFIDNYMPVYKTGFGRWAVENKFTNEFMGWCGLKYLAEENEVDVGYRFLPECWGKGYAVETALACCDYGFKEKKLNRIIAHVHKENYRSIRVAEKIGMVFEKEFLHDGEQWINFIVPPELFTGKKYYSLLNKQTGG